MLELLKPHVGLLQILMPALQLVERRGQAPSL